MTKNRLETWLNRHHQWDEFQYAYRKDRSVIKALLLYTLSVIAAKTEGLHTVTAFVDLQGAFDRVWREAVLFKLYEAGLRGRLLLTIYSFLSSRKARAMVNKHFSDWLESEVGVPQGSILAPILFLFFILDLTSKIPHHVSYADDLTTYFSHARIEVCIEKTQHDLQTIDAWCKKWGQVYHKTEVMCHSPTGTTTIQILDRGKILPQVTERRWLGAIVDDQLNFKPHIQYAAGRASSALNSISSVIKYASIDMALQLSHVLVFPHILNSYIVWCGSPASRAALEAVHRRALIRATGAFSSTSTASLEVLTNTAPLDLQLNETLLLQFARVLRCPEDPLFRLVLTLVKSEKFLSSPTKSPIHTLLMLIQESNIDVFRTEKVTEPNFRASLSFNAPALHLGPKFGSTGSRTSKQQKEAREYTTNTLINLGDTPVIFTDGSALNNPGPCGAAAVIYPEGISSTPVISKEAVTASGTSYLGELWGLILGLNFLRNCSPPVRVCHIFCDCESALLSAASFSSQQQAYQKEVTSINSLTSELIANGCDLTLHWVAGHTGLEPNELADVSAKEAAEDAALLIDSDDSLTIPDIKRDAKKYTCSVWQRRWNRLNEGRLVHRCCPRVSLQKLKYSVPKKAQSARVRLITGHNNLADHMFKCRLKDSPNCQCTTGRQTAEHILLHCPTMFTQRQKMLDAIELSYVKNKTPYPDRIQSLANLLAPNHSKITNKDITTAVSEFLMNCSYKI